MNIIIAIILLRIKFSEKLNNWLLTFNACVKPLNLISNLIKRNVDPKVIKLKSSESASGNTIRQNYDLLEGIDQEVGKKITKLIKESKLKVQAKIQGNELRISGAKKDNLQEAISKIKELKLELPLQYINFRD